MRYLGKLQCSRPVFVKIKLSEQFFTEVERTILNFIQKIKKPRIVKTILHRFGIEFI